MTLRASVVVAVLAAGTAVGVAGLPLSAPLSARTAGGPIADPLTGLAITLVILRITWHSWPTIRAG